MHDEPHQEHREEGASLLSVAAEQLDARLERDPAWGENIERSGAFSHAELQRVSFLLHLLAYIEEHAIDAEVRRYGDLLGGLEAAAGDATRRTIAFLSADAKTLPAVAADLRRTLLQFEEKLTAIRQRETVQMDCHLDIGLRMLQTRRNVGLALGGGGLWGLAHIGVLEELQKAGIPLHLIAGASMGALVGGVTSGFVDERGRLKPEGIEYMKRVAANIRTYNQLSKTTWKGETSLPLDTLLKPGGEDDPTYHELMGSERKPTVPYFAQVAEHRGMFKKKEIFLAGETMQDIMKEGGVAAASGANKPMFHHDPVEIDGKIYSDDTSIAMKSVTAAVEKLRSSGAKVVIGVPVGFIDTDIKPWRWLQWVQDRLFPRLRDRGDVIVQPKEGRGPTAGGRALTNFGRGFPMIGEKFARTQEQIASGKRIPIPADEFIEAGREASRKALPAIFEEMGLIPLHPRS